MWKIGGEAAVICTKQCSCWGKKKQAEHKCCTFCCWQMKDHISIIHTGTKLGVSCSLFIAHAIFNILWVRNKCFKYWVYAQKNGRQEMKQDSKHISFQNWASAVPPVMKFLCWWNSYKIPKYEKLKGIYCYRRINLK